MPADVGYSMGTVAVATPQHWSKQAGVNRHPPNRQSQELMYGNFGILLFFYSFYSFILLFFLILDRWS